MTTMSMWGTVENLAPKLLRPRGTCFSLSGGGRSSHRVLLQKY
jgi:hypothetical protein